MRTILELLIPSGSCCLCGIPLQRSITRTADHLDPLVRTPDDKAALSTREAYEGFHPTFTYPICIFGEDEKIYGYQGLMIDLKFASGSLAQLLSISYSERLPSSTAVDDIEGALSKHIPPGYDTDPEAFAARVEADARSCSRSLRTCSTSESAARCFRAETETKTGCSSRGVRAGLVSFRMLT
ncbi:hypothetical protein CERSUDRAFT_150068 [Gelatoporia subvermispora B]|uniref:Histone acetyltransferase type B catalytic subunit n=1 Tax=Ceriporiopsis subvermispora (strain B) TaxID=914234 RepID=M2RL47_CERS8|nr:hypothetical protein CERSUDRAFT_150068 [Gelatoporia subvermispora B]